MKQGLKIFTFVIVLFILWQIVVFIWQPEYENDLRIAVDGQIVETENNAYLQGEPMACLDWLAEIMNIQVEQNGFKIQLTLVG